MNWTAGFLAAGFTVAGLFGTLLVWAAAQQLRRFGVGPDTCDLAGMLTLFVCVVFFVAAGLGV